jgi:hypothetical protein
MLDYCTHTALLAPCIQHSSPSRSHFRSSLICSCSVAACACVLLDSAPTSPTPTTAANVVRSYAPRSARRGGRAAGGRAARPVQRYDAGRGWCGALKVHQEPRELEDAARKITLSTAATSPPSTGDQPSRSTSRFLCIPGHRCTICAYSARNYNQLRWVRYVTRGNSYVCRPGRTESTLHGQTTQTGGTMQLLQGTPNSTQTHTPHSGPTTHTRRLLIHHYPLALRSFIQCTRLGTCQ